MLNGHGNDIFRYGDIKADFSTNVVPYEYNLNVLNRLKSAVTDFSEFINYPEPDAESYSKLFEQKHNLPAGSTLTLNGSTEGIYLIAETYKKSDTLIFTPTFVEYEDASKKFRHNLTFKTNRDFRIDKNYDIIFLCNPNNPDGKVYPLNEIKHFLQKFKNTLFVVDEAYSKLSRDCETSLNLLNDYKNLIVLKSFTKYYSIPGVRLGVLTGHPKVVKKIKINKIPWSVGSFALKIGKLIAENIKDSAPDLTKLFEESEKLKTAISAIDRLKVYPSATPFFLVKSGSLNAKKLKQTLVENYKILIRDASNFRGLSKYHFRLSTQAPEKNRLLLNALREIYA